MILTQPPMNGIIRPLPTQVLSISPFWLQENSPIIKPPISWGVDNGNLLASGLVFYALPGDINRGEYVSHLLGTLEGSLSDWNITTQPEGPVVLISGTTGRLSYPWNPLIESITDQCTILVRMSISLLNNFSHIFNFPYASGTWVSPFVSMNIQRSGTTSSLIFNYASAGAPIAATSDTGIVLADNVYRTFGCSRSGPDVVFYVNGFQSGAAKTLATNTATDWGSRQPPTLCNRSSTSDGERTTARVVYAAAWNRALTAEEHRYFYYNPFSILSPIGE